MHLNAVTILSDQRCQVVNIDDAAAALGVHPSTLRAAIKAGTSPVRSLTIGRRVVIARAELDRALGRAKENEKEKRQ